MQLKGKRIIVTGGAGGIAAATTRAYVREGAVVTVVDISDECAIKNVKAANELGGGSAEYIHCNISNPAEVQSVFETAERNMGGLDVLAHIAAAESNKPAEDFTIEEMNFLWGVNINGTILTNQAACRLMKKQEKGAIINYASDVAMTGMPNSALYAASKGAVMSWTRSIAHEWGAKYTIRANCINPTILTPMYEKWRANASPEVLKMHDMSNKFGYPIGGGMGNADTDLAPLMVFLATDGSGYINGQVFAVNGGANMVR
jgi:NAD(P)-dependent dehydrogenase (short-subunit alcohol dehydrogenase family)